LRFLGLRTNWLIVAIQLELQNKTVKYRGLMADL
jgi:hypothetical protein